MREQKESKIEKRVCKDEFTRAYLHILKDDPTKREADDGSERGPITGDFVKRQSICNPLIVQVWMLDRRRVFFPL